VKSELVRQLRADEGVRRTVYRCSQGYLTIGVGRNVDPNQSGTGLRDDEIAFLLNNDIDERIDALTRALPWFQDLDDVRKGVLLNMSFMGVAKLLEFKRTLDFVRHGMYGHAAEEMLDSLWAKQVGPRALRLSQQMRSGNWVFQ
jgi:lysozyme